ncbi:hypothetical protein Tco_1517127 [Tanacetum coccineum]
MKSIKPSSASQWRPRETKHVCSSREPRIVEARTTNHLEPNKNRGSNVSISPCSSSVQCMSYKSYLGLAPHRKEMCTLQCALSSKEEKSSWLRAVLSTTSISSPARSVNKWINYFNPLPRAVSPDSVAVATPRAVDPAGSPSSTTIDQDVPSANSSSEETTLQGDISSNLHYLNQSFDTFTKLTKNHPLENVIGDPSRPVSTRSQPQEHAIWCYFDSNDNPIPFGGKQSG